MTGERDVLRELEAALDVLPSAGFEARVRERVRSQPMRSARWTWTAAVAVAATATVVLAVTLMPEPHVAPSPRPVRSDTKIEEPTPAAPTGRPAPRGIGTTPAAAVRHVPRTEPRAGGHASSAAVVVPAGQTAAIQRLVTEVAAGRVVAAPERPPLAAALQVTALEVAAPIEFDTIRFTPLSAEASPDLWR